MGEEISSFDWLPAGWTVEAKVRRNGKRDKVGTLQPFDLVVDSRKLSFFLFLLFFPLDPLCMLHFFVALKMN